MNFWHLLFIFLISSSGVFSWEICGEEIPIHPESGAITNHQEDIAYNAHRNEYLLVFIETSGYTTSVVTQRLYPNGTLVGEKNTLYGPESPQTKRFPKVAWNSVDGVFFVAFEIEVSPGEFNIFGVPVSEQGTRLGSNIYGLADGLGNEGELEIVYDQRTNLYAIVFEVFGVGGADIYFMMVDAIGSVYQSYTVYTPNRDGSPYLCRDSESGNFLLVWELTFMGQVFAGAVTTTWDNYGNLSFASNATFIGLYDSNRNPLNTRHPRCAYSDASDFYLLAFQVDFPPSQSAVYGVATTRDTAIPYGNLEFIGSDLPQDRLPELTYSSITNQFFVAFESGDEFTSNVYVRIINATEQSTVFATNFAHYVSEEELSEGQEYRPQTAYSLRDNSFMAIWSHGNPPPVETTGSTTGNSQSTTGDAGSVTSGADVTTGELTTGLAKRSSKEISKKSATLQTMSEQVVMIEKSKMKSVAIAVSDSTVERVERRQDESGSLVGRNICIPGSGNRLTTSNKVLIGVLVPLCIIVAALGGALLYVTVIRKYLRKKNAERYGRQFDPELVENQSVPLPQVDE